MNINILESNQVYKNYKELCGALNEKEKGGKSKKLQLKEWERYFSFHKEGQKIIIDEVYENPKEKIDGRKNNGYNSTGRESKYYNDFLVSLSYAYWIRAKDYDNKTQYWLVTGRTLDQWVGLSANSYGFIQEDKQKYREAYDLIINRASSIRNYQLKKLVEDKIITCEKTLMINSKREATDEEKTEWENAIRYVTEFIYNVNPDSYKNLIGTMMFRDKTFLNSVKMYYCNHMNELYELRQDDEFIQRVSPCYKIIYNPNHKNYFDTMLYEASDYEFSRQSINDIFCEAMYNAVEKQWNKKGDFFQTNHPKWLDNMKECIEDLLTKEWEPTHKELELWKDYYDSSIKEEDEFLCDIFG